MLEAYNFIDSFLLLLNLVNANKRMSDIPSPSYQANGNMDDISQKINCE